MSAIIDTLIEMGFPREKAELAVTRTGANDVHVAMDWILSHEDEIATDSAPVEPVVATEPVNAEPDPTETAMPVESSITPDNTETSDQPSAAGEQVVKSIKCEDCGKLFQSQAEVEFHATKSGHEHFSESTEEKKPLTEEEKKDQLAKIEAKLRQRRQEREAREKQEALEKERNRIKSGKEMLEAKKKYEDLEMRKLVEQRRREKEDEKLARQRVKEQIEQDKLQRKAKFSGQPLETPPVEAQKQPPPVSQKPAASYSEVHLQIRLTNGTTLAQTFGAREPLSAVRLYVELNRKDDSGPFSLMTNYPKKVFGPEDFDAPLETLGLGPRALLIVSKS